MNSEHGLGLGTELRQSTLKLKSYDFMFFKNLYVVLITADLQTILYTVPFYMINVIF